MGLLRGTGVAKQRFIRGRKYPADQERQRYVVANPFGLVFAGRAGSSAPSQARELKYSTIRAARILCTCRRTQVSVPMKKTKTHL